MTLRARALLLIAMLIPGACAGSRPAAPSAADLPDDFCISITTLPPEDKGPKLLAPAWYTLSPDDVLHIALGERLSTSTAPPAVRTLSREQVRKVWELVVAGGLVVGDEAPVPDWQVSKPGAGAMVFIAASGRRRSFALPASEVGRIQPVVDELRRLGWVLPQS
jgi:hypothetical protein